MSHKHVSKFLSYVLRHQPQAIGLELDAHGWARVDELIEKSIELPLSHELIQEVVQQNDKQRFALSEDGQRIRANQGHSIKVELQLSPRQPPDVLYHGTTVERVAAIMAQGLQKQRRHHVHLSVSTEVARQVGSRYGKVQLLKIDAQSMHQQGHLFYCSENQVWLVDQVPSPFIEPI